MTAALYCTVLYCTVPYCTVLYCTLLYYKKLENLPRTDKHSENKEFKNWGHSNPLWIVGRGPICRDRYSFSQRFYEPQRPYTVLIGPRPTIHRGLEWPQFLNSLSVLCLIVCKFSPFHSLARSFHFISFISNSKIFAVNSFHSTRRYIGTAVGPLHPALHRNGA